MRYEEKEYIFCVYNEIFILLNDTLSSLYSIKRLEAVQLETGEHLLKINMIHSSGDEKSFKLNRVKKKKKLCTNYFKNKLFHVHNNKPIFINH